MRTVATWLTVLSLALTPLSAYAEPAKKLDAPTVGDVQHAGRALSRLNSTPRFKVALEGLDVELLKNKLSTEAKAKPKEVMVGVGQTLLTMVILASAEMTIEQMHKNGGTPTVAQMKKIASEVSKATLNSPEIYTSIFSSGVFSLFNKPAVTLTNVMMNPKLRASLGPLVARSVTTTITFAGWDFGAQLWTEASMLLPTKEERDLAQSSFGLSKGVMTAALAASHVHANSKLDQERASVARKMITNMFLVLHTSSLRNELLYNFFRADILTGEFQTMLASAIACGAIGTMIFPGAGTLAGLIFGAAGVVIAQFIPQPIKDHITNGFQFARRKTVALMLDINYTKIAAALNPRNALNFDDLKLYLSRRVNERSWWTTIVFEHMYLEARAKDFSQIQAHFLEIKGFYARQLDAIHQLQKVRAMSDQMLRRVLFRDEFRCRQMIEYADALAAASQLDPQNSELMKTIEAMESRGFDETQAVLSWIQSA